ncbi:MAG: STAS domain-containing protein [Magnetococcales bacterium]|nr:STAS domain-containing protein [Magnetococcales bacterium]
MIVNANSGGGRIQVRRTNQEVRICVKGAFTHSLRQEFREAYYTYPANAHYVLDLSEVSMMDSSAMGMLLILRKHAGDDKADITLTNLPPRLLNLIKMSGMQKIFEVA